MNTNWFELACDSSGLWGARTALGRDGEVAHCKTHGPLNAKGQKKHLSLQKSGSYVSNPRRSLRTWQQWQHFFHAPGMLVPQKDGWFFWDNWHLQCLPSEVQSTQCFTDATGNTKGTAYPSPFKYCVARNIARLRTHHWKRCHPQSVSEELFSMSRLTLQTLPKKPELPPPWPLPDTLIFILVSLAKPNKLKWENGFTK